MTGRQEYDRTKDRQRILDEYMIDKPFWKACLESWILCGNSHRSSRSIRGTPRSVSSRSLHVITDWLFHCLGRESTHISPVAGLEAFDVLTILYFTRQAVLFVTGTDTEKVLPGNPVYMSCKLLSVSLLLDPDPHSQYGSGSRITKSMWIHAEPDPQHWLSFIYFWFSAIQTDTVDYYRYCEIRIVGHGPYLFNGFARYRYRLVDYKSFAVSGTGYLSTNSAHTYQQFLFEVSLYSFSDLSCLKKLKKQYWILLTVRLHILCGVAGRGTGPAPSVAPTRARRRSHTSDSGSMCTYSNPPLLKRVAFLQCCGSGFVGSVCF